MTRRIALATSLTLAACGGPQTGAQASRPPRQTGQLAVVLPRQLAPTSTTPSPTPTTHPPPRAPTTAELEDAIRRFFGAAGERAIRVAWCESGMRPEARSRGNHAGLFQLARIHEARARRLGYSWRQMFDAEPNIVVAADLYREQGWRPWACRRAA